MNRVSLLKIHGDYNDSGDRWEIDPIITETDFREFEFEQPALFNFLKALFTSHLVVVVGFNPDDYNFLRFFDFANYSLRNMKPDVYFVSPKDPGFNLLIEQKATHFPMTAADFLGFVQYHADYEGGQVGNAFRERRKHRGPVKRWACRQCEVAERILERFPHLCRVEVVGESAEAAPDARLPLGRRASAVLRDCIRPDRSVAMSCGSTLRMLAQSSEPGATGFARTRLWSTSLAALDDSAVLSSYGLITLLAQRLEQQGVRARTYQFPAAVTGSWTPETIANLPPGSGPTWVSGVEETVVQYLESAAAADVFVLGVGCVESLNLGLHSYLRECVALGTAPEKVDRELDELAKILLAHEFVGDVSYRLFRRTDAGSIALLDERTVANELARMDLNATQAQHLVNIVTHVRTVPRLSLEAATQDINRTVILVAGGVEKADALWCLCGARLGDTLVVNFDLADELRRRIEAE